jgi:hypothetical protein
MTPVTKIGTREVWGKAGRFSTVAETGVTLSVKQRE